MSLSVALQVAQSALSARQTESSVIARNISGAQDPGYSRKSVLLSQTYTSSGQSGGLRIDGIARVTDSSLYASLLTSTSVGTSQEALLAGLTRMSETINDTQLEMSPAAKLGELKLSLQSFASDPNNSVMAQDVLTTSKEMAQTLRASSEIVQDVRASADSDMATSVKSINQLLGQLEDLNSIIVKGNQSGADVTDALDSRDQVLLSLSEEIGITTLNRADGDIVVYTDSGVTLFETTARDVSFAPTVIFDPTTTGNAVFVDGVPVAGPGAVMELNSGRLHGLAELRDETAVTYQNQLDEVARGLIEAFAEENQTTPGTFQAGLFTWSGAPNVPATSTLSVGLAWEIEVNANADPDQGGNIDLIRDGGISDPLDPDYDYNPTNAAGFSGRLQELVSAFDTDRVFDAGVELDPADSLSGFAASSVSWLESNRKTMTSSVEVQTVIIGRTAENLSNETGVNIDEEMTLLLEIERAYAAASRLITAVDSMLDDLLAAAR
ncbi:flagellar hook-associated protein FlgK [Roseibium denhamense]|uniref:Flagellar hook-associated protein 1 n=1 Tax=Roseibium denhamense TaxID=76305 RepID=A0ABY1PH54_9HYPH|nr:flagellar hook-associated protein FlgK [Roseibium denhamense]MTI06240.1 flagellar hook-associated protein FlgK [Roseibium denhamense]SMP32742.1 flagellar hook-associated protein 1 FlgK [Roseibium denhamense]